MSEKCTFPFCGCTQMQGELGKEVLHCDKTPIPEHWRINPFFKATLPSKEYRDSRETIERQAHEIEMLTRTNERLNGDLLLLHGRPFDGRNYTAMNSRIDEQVEHIKELLEEVKARDKEIDLLRQRIASHALLQCGTSNRDDEVGRLCREIDRLRKRLQQAEYQVKIADFKQESPMWQEFLESIVKARFLLLEEWIKDLKNQIAALKNVQK